MSSRPSMRPDLTQAAANQRESQFESWDMLAGVTAPELGGHPRYLDIMGVNFYHSNQWEYPNARLRWEDTPRDPRWQPLHRILAEVYDRYRRPLFIGETSHIGIGRAQWLREIAAELWSANDSVFPSKACVCSRSSIGWIGTTSSIGTTAACGISSGRTAVLKESSHEEYAQELRHSQALLWRAAAGATVPMTPQIDMKWRPPRRPILCRALPPPRNARRRWGRRRGCRWPSGPPAFTI